SRGVPASRWPMAAHPAALDLVRDSHCGQGHVGADCRLETKDDEFLGSAHRSRRPVLDEAHSNDAAPTSRNRALLAIDRVGLTTNNLTYTALGDALRYWNYFPTDMAGMARIPLWGYADVIESNTESLRPGDRVFGYLPSSSHLVVTPEALGADKFRDTTPHRADLMPIYNYDKKGLHQLIPRG
ncbi:DUF2855 family protein, partial [Nocardia xishanensis]